MQISMNAHQKRFAFWLHMHSGDKKCTVYGCESANQAPYWRASSGVSAGAYGQGPKSNKTFWIKFSLLPHLLLQPLFTLLLFLTCINHSSVRSWASGRNFPTHISYWWTMFLVKCCFYLILHVILCNKHVILPVYLGLSLLYLQWTCILYMYNRLITH